MITKGENWMNMLSFELSAIDIILALAVLILFVLYWTKVSRIPDERFFRGIMTQNISQENFAPNPKSDDTACPRGFGNIRQIGEDGSVSEKCLGCYRIMECYSESAEIRSRLSQV
jgi:hypothetical protein